MRCVKCGKFMRLETDSYYINEDSGPVSLWICACGMWHTVADDYFSPNWFEGYE